MVCSVTEGEDKPLKYPLMFRTCELVVVNKIDLLPHLDYDLDELLTNIESVNPGAEVMECTGRRTRPATSARPGRSPTRLLGVLRPRRDEVPDPRLRPVARRRGVGRRADPPAPPGRRRSRRAHPPARHLGLTPPRTGRQRVRRTAIAAADGGRPRRRRGVPGGRTGHRDRDPGRDRRQGRQRGRRGEGPGEHVDRRLGWRRRVRHRRGAGGGALVCRPSASARGRRCRSTPLSASTSSTARACLHVPNVSASGQLHCARKPAVRDQAEQALAVGRRLAVDRDRVLGS